MYPCGSGIVTHGCTIIFSTASLTTVVIINNTAILRCDKDYLIQDDFYNGC